MAAPRPSLLTGTSTEFLGRRALPRVIAARHTLVVVGPSGVGKSAVARRLVGPSPLVLDGSAIQEALIARVSRRRWPRPLVHSARLVLDGPQHLDDRVQVLSWVADLIRQRDKAGRRTAVVGVQHDRSVPALMARMTPGSVVLLALRFPSGKQSRLRFARMLCDERGLPIAAAKGTARLEPWTYRHVAEYLDGWSPPAPPTEDA